MTFRYGSVFAHQIIKTYNFRINVLVKNYCYSEMTYRSRSDVLHLEFYIPVIFQSGHEAYLFKHAKL